jgi:hypothetical protein
VKSPAHPQAPACSHAPTTGNLHSMATAATAPGVAEGVFSLFDGLARSAASSVRAVSDALTGGQQQPYLSLAALRWGSFGYTQKVPLPSEGPVYEDRRLLLALLNLGKVGPPDACTQCHDLCPCVYMVCGCVPRGRRV